MALYHRNVIHSFFLLVINFCRVVMNGCVRRRKVELCIFVSELCGSFVMYSWTFCITTFYGAKYVLFF